MRKYFIYSLLHLHLLIVAIYYHILIVANNLLLVVFSEIKSRREYIGSVFVEETLLIDFCSLGEIEFFLHGLRFLKERLNIEAPPDFNSF